jgi:hypothetical protein
MFMGDVQQAAILDIGVGADFNLIDIRSDDGVKPDACPVVYLRATDNYRGGRNKDALRHLGMEVFERQLHMRFSLARNTASALGFRS